MTALTKSSVAGAEQVQILTQKTLDDTSAMKVLSLMALLYVPANFTSVRKLTSPSVMFIVFGIYARL